MLIIVNQYWSTVLSKTNWLQNEWPDRLHFIVGWQTLKNWLLPHKNHQSYVIERFLYETAPHLQMWYSTTSQQFVGIWSIISGLDASLGVSSVHYLGNMLWGNLVGFPACDFSLCWLLFTASFQFSVPKESPKSSKEGTKNIPLGPSPVSPK